MSHADKYEGGRTTEEREPPAHSREVTYRNEAAAVGRENAGGEKGEKPEAI